MRRLFLSAKQMVVVAGCLVLIGSLWTFLSPVSALGEIWRQPTSDVEPRQQLTGVDGSLHMFRCSSADTPFEMQSFDSEGTVIGAIPSPVEEGGSINFCGDLKALDANGVLYGTLRKNSPDENHIVAYDGSTRLWSKQLTDPTACDGEPIDDFRYKQMVVGADGYLYVVSRAHGCSGGGSPFFLSKFRPSDGAVIFNKKLGDYGARWLGAYDEGVVLFSSREKLRYFDFNGTETATVDVEPNADHHDAEAATADGRVYFDIAQNRQYEEACNENEESVKIVGYDPSGKVFDHALPSCVKIQSLAVTPAHNVAFTEVSADFNNPQSTPRFVKVAPDGTVIASELLPGREGAYVYSRGGAVTADTNGNILLVRHFERDDDRRIGAQFTLSEGGSDSVLGSLSTDSLNTEKGMSVLSSAVGMASGRLYIHAEHCTFPDECRSGDPGYMYAIDFPELGMDYPRGAVLGMEPAKTLSYLALGDSFSSGEGDLEGETYYVPGTDGEAQPKEKCHLSTRSYPYLLAQQSDIGDEFFKSVACSGALSNDVLDDLDSYLGHFEQYEGVPALEKDNLMIEALETFTPGRAAQIEFVKKYRPKALTISIGGNDINFSDKLKTCLMPGPTCSHVVKKIAEGEEIAGLYGELKELYEELHLASKGTKIYVVGYPQFISDLTFCKPNVHLSNEEREYVRESVSYLNDIIAAAAKDAGVFYVDIEDSLKGKALCDIALGDEQLAVNGVIAGDDLVHLPVIDRNVIGNETYHPNQIGHTAMAGAFTAVVANPVTHDTCPYSSDITDVVCPGGRSEIPVPQYFQNPESIFVKAQKYVDFALPIISDAIGDFSDRLVGGFKVSIKNLQPASTVRFELWSQPVDLGTYTANESGELNVELSIPDNVSPGYHTLHAHVTTDSGEQIDYYQTVLVTGSENDIDGDGTLNESDKCTFVEPAGIDIDRDSIDDACDAFIDKPPLPEAPTVEITDPINAINQTEAKVSGMGEADTAAVSVDDENPETSAVTATTSVESSTYSKTLDVSSLDDGTLTATVTLKNEAGEGPAGTASGAKDTSLPKTEAATSPGPNIAGWHNRKVTVNLNSNDEGAGVKQLTYSATGAQIIPETTVAESSEVSIPISAEGETTLTYFSTDKAGNVEQAETLTIRLDKTGSATTIDQRNYALLLGLFGGTLSGKATDSLSGTAETEVIATNMTTGIRSTLTARCAAGCAEGATNSAWKASMDSLPTGIYTTTATSIDRADNKGEQSESAQVIVVNFTWSWGWAFR